jgi:hypothetical protein
MDLEYPKALKSVNLMGGGLAGEIVEGVIREFDEKQGPKIMDTIIRREVRVAQLNQLCEKSAQNHGHLDFVWGRERFAEKLLVKLKSVFGQFSGSIKTQAHIRDTLPVTAFVSIEMENDGKKCSFIMHVSIRHGWRGRTSYWQYPATFSHVFIDGREVKYASEERLGEAVRELYDLAPKAPSEMPEKVEPTRNNLGMLVTLASSLAKMNKVDKREAGVLARAVGRSSKGLGIVDPTLEDVASVLRKSFPEDLVSRLRQAREGFPVSRKRSYPHAAQDKMLKALRLIVDTVNWADSSYSYRLTSTGKNILEIIGD